MAYARPSDLNTGDFTLVMAQGVFPGSNVPSYGPFGVTGFNVGSHYIYVAVWDDRMPGSSPFAVSHTPIIYTDSTGRAQAQNLIALTVPDQSNYAGPIGVTADIDEYNEAFFSGTRQLFYDPAAAGHVWPAAASIRFLGRSNFASDGSRSLTSPQEVLVFAPSGGGGGGGGTERPQDCGPVPRPPWPYVGSMNGELRSSGSRQRRRRSSGVRLGPYDIRG